MAGNPIYFGDHNATNVCFFDKVEYHFGVFLVPFWCLFGGTLVSLWWLFSVTL